MHFNPYIAHWNEMYAPLRPCAETLKTYRRLFLQRHVADSPPSVLLLGVTPELATAEWLRSAHITAVDHSEAMIAHIWPGNDAHRRAVLGDWLTLPMEPESQDCVIGDGIFNFFSYPTGHEELARSLARVLKKEGQLIIRAFCPPERLQPTEVLFRKAKQGQIRNFNEFKLLLLAAIQNGNAHEGVGLTSVWEKFQSEFPSFEECAIQTGWPHKTIETIDLYKNNAVRYHLATPSEIEIALSQFFTLEKIENSPTNWESHTPLMSFRKKEL
jgi:SAM-dependent methyltransferase